MEAWLQWRHRYISKPTKKKVEAAEKLCALKERVASIEGAIASNQQQYPEARSMAQLETSPVGLQRRSSVASTEYPTADREETIAEHYPVDDIAVRTPCELLYQLRKKLKVVAHGVAEVPVQGGTIHGMAIPEGYAESWLTVSRKDGKTSTSRSLEAMEKKC
jgi:hypothetical protein